MLVDTLNVVISFTASSLNVVVVNVTMNFSMIA